jgi:hypothetical protein
MLDAIEEFPLQWAKEEAERDKIPPRHEAHRPFHPQCLHGTLAQ